MMADNSEKEKAATGTAARDKKNTPNADKPKEVGGPKGPEPTRFGDWERNGIASDF